MSAKNEDEKIKEKINHKTKTNFKDDIKKKTIYSEDEINNIYVRIIPARNSFPLTGAGKRSAAALEEMSFENCFKLNNMKNENKEKNLVMKK